MGVVLTACGSSTPSSTTSTAAGSPTASGPTTTGSSTALGPATTSSPTTSGLAAANPPAVTGATDVKVEPVIGPGSAPPPTSLETKDLVVGTGPAAVASSTVDVFYVGANYTNGKVFDDTPWRQRQAAPFPLSGVVPGFGQGIVGMKVGGRREIVIPARARLRRHRRLPGRLSQRDARVRRRPHVGEVGVVTGATESRVDAIVASGTGALRCRRKGRRRCVRRVDSVRARRRAPRLSGASPRRGDCPPPRRRCARVGAPSRCARRSWR